MSTSDTPDVLPQGMRFHAGDLGDAYVAGATSARRHHPASDELVSRSCDAYVKHAHLVRLDPMSDTPAVPVSRPVDLEAWERLARAIIAKREERAAAIAEERWGLSDGLFLELLRATEEFTAYVTPERILGLIGEVRQLEWLQRNLVSASVFDHDGEGSVWSLEYMNPADNELNARTEGHATLAEAITAAQSAAPEERDDATTQQEG